MRVFRRGASRFYSVEYRHPHTGRKVSHLLRPKTLRQDTAAVLAAREYAAAADGHVISPRRSTVGDVLDAYEKHLGARAHSAKTLRAYASIVRFWRDRFGTLPLHLLTLAQVDHELQALSRTHSEAALSNRVIVLRAAFRRAIPGHEVSLRLRNRYRPAERHVTWTAEELAAALASLPEWARGPIELAAATGMRIGDVVRAEWSWFETEGVATFPSRKPGRVVTIPLTLAAQAVLERIPRGSSPFLFPGRRRPKEHLSQDTLAAAWRERPAALQGKTIHDLRRTLATAAWNTGAHAGVVAALLGQRSTAVVPRYTQAHLETLRAAAERASASLAPAQDASASNASGNASTFEPPEGSNPQKQRPGPKRPKARPERPAEAQPRAPRAR